MYMTALSAAGAGGTNEINAQRFVVVRFGNVIGSAGSVIPLFQRQVENGRPITITNAEVSRFFMTVSEAVGLVLLSGTTESKGNVYVLDMGEAVKIAELADDLVGRLGLSPLEVDRKYIGLRPGEKLHEILWEEGEEVLPSEHKRIFTIRQQPRSLREMETLVDKLEALALEGKIGELLQGVQEIIPSYLPSLQRPSFIVPEAGEKYRLLVVDDDREISGLLRDAFAGIYEVVTAFCAREGFDRLRSWTPHLILLDVRLPDENGVDMCRKLSAHPEYSQIPIIMMTAYSDEESVTVALRAGADDYVVKPFDLEELHARVEAVLRRRAWKYDLGFGLGGDRERGAHSED